MPINITLNIYTADLDRIFQELTTLSSTVHPILMIYLLYLLNYVKKCQLLKQYLINLRL